jgi:hypothetical protein
LFVLLGLFAGGFFVSLGLAGRFFLTGFFTTKFFAPFRFATRFFAAIFMTAFRFAARQLDAAQRAAKGLDFALVIVLLVLGEFNEFQDFFHLFECVLEGFDDMADFVRGFADGGEVGRKILFPAWFVGRRTLGARRFNGPLFGGLLHRRRFGQVFLRDRCGWFVTNGRRRRGTD